MLTPELSVSNMSSGRAENDGERENSPVAMVEEDEGRDVVAELLRRGCVVSEVEGDEVQSFPRSAGFGVVEHGVAELAQLAVMAGHRQTEKKGQLRQF